ncbi:hypothetical protein B188_00200 [Candidatus Brocadiaceae bacterium B188]|nr:hypothetical protein [Candidatus Brocadia sapporoensis]QQR67290.1 MAG: hypothetical protein IPI25_03430 [Candidatus Brocadia sp.]RZV56616.1 MAG: hypothetical protein EX330_12855 [Candidatus Brocadia sp. BROELEC01]TWU52073.1 hypothetical protein B188_00200 [Candidatus Brocadiaceae bacterium B188]
MPIEIKELHIRIAVNTPQTGQTAGIRTAVSGNNSAANDVKEAIVAECVEQVLQIFQNKAER